MGAGRRQGALSLLLLAAACAHTVKDFKPEELKPDEGVALGRVRVRLNGIDETAHCGVCFNSVNGPCLKLDQTGLIVMPLSAGPATFRRIACDQKVEHHYHFVGSEFTVTAAAKTYFGHVTLDWDNDRTFKPSVLFGAIGAAIDQSINDGVISMKVDDAPDDAVKLYRQLVPKDELPLEKSILAIGE